MDRNVFEQLNGKERHVATREGGVDRNLVRFQACLTSLKVATREGGVDRNIADNLPEVIIAGRHPRGWRG